MSNPCPFPLSFQSHLHRPDIDLRFLTCEPNLTANIADPGGDSYADEADEFYAAPEKWLASEHREEVHQDDSTASSNRIFHQK